jgi:hypothetical protein
MLHVHHAPIVAAPARGRIRVNYRIEDRVSAYMPIAWYPLSTYSVVPVTLAAPSPRR